MVAKLVILSNYHIRIFNFCLHARMPASLFTILLTFDDVLLITHKIFVEKLKCTCTVSYKNSTLRSTYNFVNMYCIFAEKEVRLNYNTVANLILHKNCNDNNNNAEEPPSAKEKKKNRKSRSSSGRLGNDYNWWVYHNVLLLIILKESIKYMKQMILLTRFYSNLSWSKSKLKFCSPRK